MSPRNYVASWRATEIVRCLDNIEGDTLCCAYYAGLRKAGPGGQARADKIIGLIGHERHDQIMALEVPGEIIAAMLEGQKEDCKPDLWPLTEEVRAGTVAWCQTFSEFGVKHPDEEDDEQKKRDEVLSRFAEYLASYAAFAGLTLNALVMTHVRACILALVEKGAQNKYSDIVLVALAGVSGHLSVCEFLACYVMIPPRREIFQQTMEEERLEGIKLAAQWLVMNTTPSLFAHILGDRRPYTLKTAQELLSRLLDEYFPPKNQVEAEDEGGITNERLQEFIGGQIEIQCPSEGHLLRGEIAEARLEGEGNHETLKIQLAWCAEGEGYPPVPNRWVNSLMLEYHVQTSVISMTDMEDVRICFSAQNPYRVVILFPPDWERKLDPSRVEGLVWPRD